MPDENSDKPQTFVASTALKSRVCYVVQVVIFFVAVLGLVMFLTVDYVGRSGGIFINIRPCFHEVYATNIESVLTYFILNQLGAGVAQFGML